MRRNNANILRVIAWLLFPLGMWVIAEDGLYLELVLNGKNTGRIVHAVPLGNDWEINTNELRALGLVVDQIVEDKVRLSTLGDVSYSNADQQLLLQLPSSFFQMQHFGYEQQLKHVSNAKSDKGVLLNYDVVFTKNNGEDTSASLWHEMYGFMPDFYVVNRGLVQDTDYAEDYMRFESFIQYDDAGSMWSLTGGDVINGAPDWGRSVRMGGLRIARDYDLNPNLVPHPLPEFFGKSTVPSSVELIVNEQIRLQQYVEPGPYAINALPFIGGGGVAEVVTTDAQGIQSRQTVNFYVSTELLAKNLLDFDVSLGARREQFGYISNQYGDDVIASAAARYGLSRYVTPELLFQYGEGLNLQGVGVTAQLGQLGVLSLSHTESDYDNKKGKQQTIGYSYQHFAFGMYGRASRRDEYFQDLASIETLLPQQYRDLYQAGLTLSN